MKYVGIAAYSGSPPDHLRVACEEFIESLSLCCDVSKTVIVVGGYWGLMRYVVDNALKYGFKVLILPPLEMEDVNFPEEAIVVRTGTSFRVRSVFLVRTSDVLVVLGGAGGTIQELITAYVEGRPILVLSMTGLATDKLSVLAPYIDERKTSVIKYVGNPKDLAQEVCNYLRSRVLG